MPATSLEPLLRGAQWSRFLGDSVAGIDNWLPTFDVGQRHEVAVAWPPEHALRQALAAPAAPDGFVRFLFRLRGLRPHGSIEEFMAANGFLVLERTRLRMSSGWCRRTSESAGI